jgi:hypothetical protein
MKSKKILRWSGVLAALTLAVTIVPNLIAGTESAPAASPTFMLLTCNSSLCKSTGGGAPHCYCESGHPGFTCTSSGGGHCGLPPIADCTDDAVPEHQCF